MTLDRCSMGTWTQHAPTTSPPINSFASVFPTHPHTQTRNQHQPTSNPQSIQLPITVSPFHLRNVSFVCPPHSLSPDTTIVQAHITHWDNYTSCVPAFSCLQALPTPVRPPHCSHSDVLKHSLGHRACMLKDLAYWINSRGAKT